MNAELIIQLMIEMNFAIVWRFSYPVDETNEWEKPRHIGEEQKKKKWKNRIKIDAIGDKLTVSIHNHNSVINRAKRISAERFIFLSFSSHAKIYNAKRKEKMLSELFYGLSASGRNWNKQNSKITVSHSQSVRLVTCTH